jgi:hypothetical protein
MPESRQKGRASAHAPSDSALQRTGTHKVLGVPPLNLIVRRL